jgi:hypothetical protein
MNPFDVITPTPPFDEAERVRIQTIPRYRYALRVAGWSCRTFGFTYHFQRVEQQRQRATARR